MDGETYSWGTTLFGRDFRGSGTGGDFYYVVLNAVLGLLLLFAFYWFRRRWAFYGLLILWNGSMIANAFYEVFLGEGFYFRGDTLGVDLNLSYVILPFMLGVGYLTGLVIVRDLRHAFTARWSRKNSYWLAALALPLPIQYFLLREGDPHGLTDKIGVIIALLQVLLISLALKGYVISKEAGD